MPTIAQAVQANIDRVATQQNPPPQTTALTPIAIAPTPPQDLPVGLGLPQRGMFSTNVASVADRNDNARIFRGQGVRSATFPGNHTQSNVTTKVTTTNVSVTPSSSGNGVINIVNDTNITGFITGQTLTLGWLGQLSIARGGTGTSTPGLVAGSNITITGTWPNQTITATGGGGGGVTSLNSLIGDLNIIAGSGITVSVSGSNIQISATGSGGVTVTGSPSNGNLTKFSGASSITNTDLTGDITTSGTVATTLATVNTNVGSFTNANITVNAKGLITAAANGTSGSGFAPYNGMLAPASLTPPVVANFTWGNQAGATATANAGSAIYMVGPSISSESISFLYKSAPSSPWTLTLGVVPGMSRSNNNSAGIVMYESATGKLVTFFVGDMTGGGSPPNFAVTKWTTSTSLSGSYFVDQTWPTPVVWMQVSLSGSTFTFSASIDGQNFKTLVTETLTSFFTTGPDNLGFGIANGNNPGNSADAVFVHIAGI